MRAVEEFISEYDCLLQLMYGASVNQRGGARGEKKILLPAVGGRVEKLFPIPPPPPPPPPPLRYCGNIFSSSSPPFYSRVCVRGNKMVPTQTDSQGGVKSFFFPLSPPKKDEEEGTFFFSLSGLLFHLAKFPIGPFFTFPQISEAVVFAKMFQKRRGGKGGRFGQYSCGRYCSATFLPTFLLPPISSWLKKIRRKAYIFC